MSDSRDGDVTDLLIAWRGGDEEALAKLLPIVYQRLRRMAASLMRQERPDHTLQPAALVSELYLRLVDVQRVSWQDRTHFLSVCARLMHRALIDHARRHDRAKRGGGMVKVSFEDVPGMASLPSADIVSVVDALRDLEARDAELAAVVIRRYYVRLTRQEIAEVLGLSVRTVSRRLAEAVKRLREYLSTEGEGSDPGERGDGS